MSQPENITRLKQPKVVIRTEKDAKGLTPRQQKYPAKVEGITGLRLIVSPSGQKNWEAIFKLQGKATTFCYGNFPGVSMHEATRRASDDYSQIKRGCDPRRNQRLAKQQEASVNRSEVPIVTLAEERTTKLLRANEMSIENAKLDRLYIRYLDDLIGRKSFCDLTYTDYASLYERVSDDRSRCEKLNKLIKKVFNYLDSKTKEAIPIDVIDALKKAWPIPEIPTRAEAFIRQNDLGLFWTRLMHSSESDIHKDAALMALLIGERKSAVLGILKSNIFFTGDPRPYFYCEGKTSKGKLTKNVVPITPILGMFLKRLMLQSGDSDYLFPARRDSKSPTMTDVSRKLRKQDLGIISGHEHSLHTLRRTAANLAGSCLGSQNLADEHILHFTKHTSNAKANYLDSNAKEFLIARMLTFERLHKYIDDAITSQGIARGQQPPDNIWRDEPMAFIAEAITFPEELDSSNEWADERPTSPTCAQVLATETGISVTSPLYSYLAGEVITVSASEKDRPHTWKTLHSVGMLSANSPELRALLTGAKQEPKTPDFKAMIE